MRSRVVALSIAAAVVVAAGACGDDTSPAPSNEVHLSATLTPQGEVGANPAGTTAATTGTFTATLDTVTNSFTYTVTYTGLSSNVRLGHIHGPFNPGQTTPPTANVILNFDPTASTVPLGAGATFVTGATSGSGTGTVTLNTAVSFTTQVNGDSLKKLLLAGKTYANIHTVTNGGGEIRGQISVVP
jgi:hypothetical protein